MNETITEVVAVPQRWRKRPVTVEAVQWTGGNEAEVTEFARADAHGSHFDVLDDEDRENCDDPQATAQVYDKLHSTWVLVYDGQWIIKGVKGEFYPCAADVFTETYEPAEAPSTVTVTLPIAEACNLPAGNVPTAEPTPEAPVEVDMHRWYAVIRQGDKVVTVIGHTDSGVGQYESVEAWERANS